MRACGPSAATWRSNAACTPVFTACVSEFTPFSLSKCWKAPSLSHTAIATTAEEQAERSRQRTDTERQLGSAKLLQLRKISAVVENSAVWTILAFEKPFKLESRSAFSTSINNAAQPGLESAVYKKNPSHRTTSGHQAPRSMLVCWFLPCAVSAHHTRQFSISSRILHMAVTPSRHQRGHSLLH